MRIIEVTNRLRKIIKKLHHLYVSYVTGHTDYKILADNLESYKNSTDNDVLIEISLIQEKLYHELIDIIKKDYKNA